MTSPLVERFVGLDIGTTNSSVCYTTFNSGRRQFDDPRPVSFSGKNTIRSLLLLDATGERVVKSGVDVYRSPDYLRYPERVHEEFKLRLGEDPSAATYTRLLAGELWKNLLRILGVSSLPSEEHITTIGVPAEWMRVYPDRVRLVTSVIREVGFPNVEAVAEPVAAMYYHAFLGDIRFEERPQRWMVLDVGGGTTDLAIVETAEKGAHPTILHTFGKNFGGRDFDELLLDAYVIPSYWSGSHPDRQQRIGLLRFVRDFKESFSDRINRGVNYFRRSYRHSSLNQPIELTKEKFESEELALPLIERFANILVEGMRGSGQSLRDIDRVILTGGSARWYFVRDAANSFFGQDTCIISENPELTIAKGLALARTGFEPVVTTLELGAPEPEGHQELVDLDSIKLVSDEHAAAKLDIRSCRQQARRAADRYAIPGGAFALLVSPIPGASQPLLTALEAKLVSEIATIYGYRLEGKELASVVAGLLAVGTLLKLGVMETLTFVPGAGWVIKGGVAGGSIKLLGETAIKYFERRRFGLVSKEEE